MMNLELPTTAARDYLKLTGYHAIAIITTARGIPCRLRVTDDLAQCITSERERWSPYIEMTSAFWIEKIDDADRIMASVMNLRPDVLGAEGINLYAERLILDIEHFGRLYKIPITHHNVVIKRVNDVIEIVNKRMKQAQAAGDMQFFNKAFKEHRENGVPLIYGKAKAKLRDAIIRRAIQGIDALDASLLDEVFQ